jgi:hypothetical protein
MEQSEKMIKRLTVSGEQYRIQRTIGSQFAAIVYRTLCALRLALCLMGATQSRTLWAKILYLNFAVGEP